MNSCSVCGSEMAAVRYEFSWGRVIRCQGCGFLSSEVHDERESSGFYSKDYFTNPQAYPAASTSEFVAALVRARFTRIAERHPEVLDGPVLDLGCGSGQFLAAVRPLNSDVVGMERASYAVKCAGRLAPVVQADLLAPALPFADRTFALVTMWDVIEHVTRPVDLLREARRLLRPGGILVVATPNIDSLMARGLGRRWRFFRYEVYDHRCAFGRRSLVAALQSAGYVVEEASSEKLWVTADLWSRGTGRALVGLCRRVMNRVVAPDAPIVAVARG